MRYALGPGMLSLLTPLLEVIYGLGGNVANCHVVVESPDWLSSGQNEGGRYKAALKY